MSTVSATELRSNLDGIIKRVVDGEEIVLKHRFLGAIRLLPEKSTHKTIRMQGLKSFLASHNAADVPVEYRNRPIKEIYGDIIQKKHGSYEYGKK